MLDLPGGSPEGNETFEETLLRELHEECGVAEVRVLSWHPFDFFIRESSTGEPVNSNHRGLIAVARVLDDVKPIENVEDVRGVELIDPHDHPDSEFTPPLLLAISLLEEHSFLRGAGTSESH